MNQKCTEIQEEIAWGRPLEETVQSHILSCSSCSQVALEASQLDALLLEGLVQPVPAGFADRVMRELEGELAPISPDWSQRVSERLLELLGVRVIQFGLLTCGILFTLANLMRFVFGVVLPAAA